MQETPICIITITIVTHIFAAETFTCVSTIVTSNCRIATETATYIIAAERPRKYHLKTFPNATDVVTCIYAIESVSCIVPTETSACRIVYKLSSCGFESCCSHLRK